MPALDPDDLLEQADRLIAPPGGGPQSETDLRRAVSSAYYAVFHAIVTEAADRFAGRSKRQSPLYKSIYRGIEHRTLRSLCDRFAKDGNQSDAMRRYSAYAPRGTFGREWKDWAGSVAELHERRHQADYDPQEQVNASDAEVAVRLARTTVQQFRTVSRGARKAFVELLVFPPKAF